MKETVAFMNEMHQIDAIKDDAILEACHNFESMFNRKLGAFEVLLITFGFHYGSRTIEKYADIDSPSESIAIKRFEKYINRSLDKEESLAMSFGFKNGIEFLKQKVIH